MKGISDVIAMLLMLVVTIGLVGLAYSYIMSAFSSRTAVVLNIASARCSGNTVTVEVRNDGTQTSGTVTVSLLSPTGSSAGSCTINSIAPQNIGSCSITKTVSGAGYYQITITSPGVATPPPGGVYCSQ